MSFLRVQQGTCTPQLRPPARRAVCQGGTIRPAICPFHAFLETECPISAAKDLRQELAPFSRWEHGGPRSRGTCSSCPLPEPRFSGYPDPAAPRPPPRQGPAVLEVPPNGGGGRLVFLLPVYSALARTEQAGGKGSRQLTQENSGTHSRQRAKGRRGALRRRTRNGPLLCATSPMMHFLQTEGQTLPGRRATTGFTVGCSGTKPKAHQD